MMRIGHSVAKNIGDFANEEYFVKKKTFITFLMFPHTFSFFFFFLQFFYLVLMFLL